MDRINLAQNESVVSTAPQDAMVDKLANEAGCAPQQTEFSALNIAVWLLLTFVAYKLFDHALRIPSIHIGSARFVFVTGCDTGFGHVIARELDRMGLRVFAGCLTAEGEHSLRGLCSDRLLTVRLDVSKEDSVRRAYEFVSAHLPPGRGLWAIVNNAGVMGALGPVEWLQLQDFQRVLDVNLLGTVNMTKSFLPLVKRERGRVINMASILGRFSLPGCIAYNISKFGVEAFSDGLRRQLRPFGVSVHLIEPGFFKTNLSDTKRLMKGLQCTWLHAPESAKEEYGEEFFLKSLDAIEMMFDSNMVAKNLQPVIHAYSHATTGLFPRTRYVVGWDAKLIMSPLCYLPDWFTDLLMGVMDNSMKPAATQTCRKTD